MRQHNGFIRINAIGTRLKFGVLAGALSFLFLFLACGDDYPNHGPYWSHSWTTPAFTVKADEISATFTGRVGPQTIFVYGAEQGFTTDKYRVKVSFLSSAVWAYAPVVISLYDGEEEMIGSEETLIKMWSITPPEPGGSVEFSQLDVSMGSRTVRWVRFSFPDYAGTTNMQVLFYP